MELKPAPISTLFEETSIEQLSYKGYPFFMKAIGKGDPIVLLPGTGGDEKIFSRIQEPLSKQFQTYSFSHIHLPKVSEVVEAWHEVLTERIGRPFHLLGTSVGGRLVQYYAEKYPADVVSLTIGNSYVDNTEIRRRYGISTKVARFLPMRIINRISEKGMLEGFSKYPEGHLAAEFFQKKVRRSSKKEFLTRAKWNMEKLPPPKISKEIPVMVIISADDPVIDEKTRTQLMEYYSDANHVQIEWGGHFPYILNPEPYLRSVYEFVTSSNSRDMNS